MSTTSPHITLLRLKGACLNGIKFAEQYPTLAAAIQACDKIEWLRWAVDYLMPERQRVAVRCILVRNTPLADGRTMWDMLTDERLRKHIEVEEAWARGEDVTDEDRRSAWDAASDAASDAAGDAAWVAARGAAWAWQMGYIKSLDWEIIETQPTDLQP